MPAIVTSQELLAELTAMLAVAGTLHGAKATFYSAIANPASRNSAVADLTAAVVPGVALPVAITWGAPFINANGQAEVLGAPIPVVANATPGAPVTVEGAAILDTTAALLDVVDPFDTAETISLINEGFSYIPRYVLG